MPEKKIFISYITLLLQLYMYIIINAYYLDHITHLVAEPIDHLLLAKRSSYGRMSV